jgi:hypothetical protein
MPKNLGRLRPSKGLSNDLPPWESSPDFYSRLFNIVIRSGFPQRIGGKRNGYDPPTVAPYHIFNCPMLGSNFWLYQGVNKQYVVLTATHTDITLAAGLTNVTKPSQWSHAVLNGIPVMNNSLDKPTYWAGVAANKALVLPDWPANTTCALIAQHKYHLFALDITVSTVRNGNRFLWSDAAQPGAIPQLWTAAATNEAGGGQLSDTPGFITAAKSLRDTFIIYKGNSAYTVDYVKGNDKFVTKLLWPKAGALSARAVDDVSGKHVVVTQGDIVFNDGYNQPVSIAEGLVRKFLFDQIATASYELLQVMHDYVNNDVWVMFPETGETMNTLALVYNIASNAWGVVDLQDIAYAAMGIVDDIGPSGSWDSDSGTWDTDTTAWNESDLNAAIDRVLQAQPLTTKIQVFNTTDLSSCDSIIGKYGITFGEPERLKFIRQVHLRGRAFGTFYVRVGSQMFPDETTTWSAEQTITDPGQPVPITAQGRYISIEVRATDNAVYDFTGFDFEVEMRGYY